MGEDGAGGDDKSTTDRVVETDEGEYRRAEDEVSMGAIASFWCLFFEWVMLTGPKNRTAGFAPVEACAVDPAVSLQKVPRYLVALLALFQPARSGRNATNTTPLGQLAVIAAPFGSLLRHPELF